MKREDIAAVTAIESAAQITPWSGNTLADCLSSGYLCYVLEQQGQVVAFSILSFVLDESHLLNIAVAPAFQGQGLGRQLLEKSMHTARERGAVSMYLEVRASNVGAHHLYQQTGFHQTGLRKNYYRTAASNGTVDAREDAWLMEVDLAVHPAI